MEFLHNQVLFEAGTFYVGDFTAWSRDLRVTADADGVASLVRAVPLRMLADRSGLTGGLSGVLARSGFMPIHDRARVLTDVVVMIACGGRDIVDVEALRAQGAVFGPVASDTTVLRALGEIGTSRPGPIARARAAARVHMGRSYPTAVRRSGSLLTRDGGDAPPAHG